MQCVPDPFAKISHGILESRSLSSVIAVCTVIIIFVASFASMVSHVSYRSRLWVYLCTYLACQSNSMDWPIRLHYTWQLLLSALLLVKLVHDYISGVNKNVLWNPPSMVKCCSSLARIFFYKSPFASKCSWKNRSSHQGKKEVACIVSKPLASLSVM